MGNATEIGDEPNDLPVPFPCLLSLVHNKGPGPQQLLRLLTCLDCQPRDVNNTTTKELCHAISLKEKIATGRPSLTWVSGFLSAYRCGSRRGSHDAIVLKLISLFTSLLAIPLARQSCFNAFLFTGFQVVGVTLDFLNNVFLLNLSLEPAKSIFERLAFLYANLCQRIPPPNLPWGFFRIL